MFESYLKRHVVIGDFISGSCGVDSLFVAFARSVSRLLSVPVPIWINTDELKSLQPNFQTIAIGAIIRLPLLKLQSYPQPVSGCPF